MAGKFELKKSKSGQFMFTLKAGNNQVILTSEQYRDKAGAMNGIESVRKNSGNDANFEIKTAKNGQPFFTLKSANKQVIGSSEMYSSTSSLKGGIGSVRANAKKAKVIDVTE
jgi:uncharacterized protein YegP (UPF0339 family)